jgi:hypothetical protein
MGARRSYRHRVKVMEPVAVQDQTTGDMVTYWQPLALDSSVTLDAVPADVLTGPGREFREAGALRSEVSLRVSFRWFSGLLSTHRIEWEGLGYEISSIERDATGRLEYRIACRGVGQALAEVPTAALYPLADDGTVAASFGRGPAAATPPGYQSITYTYAAPATGNLALATPASANLWTSQAVAVGGNKVAAELRFDTLPSGDFDGVGLSAIASAAGSPVLSEINTFALSRSGGVVTVSGEGGVVGTTATALPGFRIGMEFDGATGAVKFVTTDGVLGTAAGRFTPGRAQTVTVRIADDGTTAAGQQVSVTLIPAAADMTLTYSAGALDLGGTEIAP